MFPKSLGHECTDLLSVKLTRFSVVSLAAVVFAHIKRADLPKCTDISGGIESHTDNDALFHSIAPHVLVYGFLFRGGFRVSALI